MNCRKNEKGFTLVELSIVMIIIGLLIGGILKGQELIANARLATGVAKVKAINAAVNTLRDSYAGLPGDVDNTRLPNCALGVTMCGSINVGTAGLNNNIIGTANLTGLAQGAGTENIVAWAQLSAADLMGGVTNGTIGANISNGTTVPSAEVAGQIFVGYENGATAPRNFVGPLNAARAGHYLLIHNGANDTNTSIQAANGANGTARLTPSQAARFDSKLDDGAPNSGSVLAMGMSDGSAFACSTSALASSVYNTATNQGIGCGLYIRIQQ